MKLVRMEANIKAKLVNVLAEKLDFWGHAPYNAVGAMARISAPKTRTSVSHLQSLISLLGAYLPFALRRS